MRRCRPVVEEPVVCENERPGAHRRHDRARRGKACDPGSDCRVADLGSRTHAPRVDQHIDRPEGLPRRIGKHAETLRRLHGALGFGHDDHPDAVVGPSLGPGAEHLLWAGPVEFFGFFEQKDGDAHERRRRPVGSEPHAADGYAGRRWTA